MRSGWVNLFLTQPFFILFHLFIFLFFLFHFIYLFVYFSFCCRLILCVSFRFVFFSLLRNLILHRPGSITIDSLHFVSIFSVQFSKHADLKLSFRPFPMCDANSLPVCLHLICIYLFFLAFFFVGGSFTSCHTDT